MDSIINFLRGLLGLGDTATPTPVNPMDPCNAPACVNAKAALDAARARFRTICSGLQAVQATETAIAQARSLADAARILAEFAHKALAAAVLVDRQTEAKVKAASGMPEVLKSEQAAAAAPVEALARAQRAARDAQEDSDVAKSALSLAEAKQSVLKAVLNVEGLEDRGAKTNGCGDWAP